MIVLAAVIMLVTAANVWVDRAALNTDNWVDASDQLLAEPTIREAISVYVVDQLYTNVDVSAQLGGLLPANLSGLSGALASALRNPATDAVDRLLATDQVATIWTDANRVTHQTIVNILEDDTRVEALSTSNGNITLDVRQIVVQLAADLGLPGAVVDRIPADAGQITIIQSSKLDNLQTAVTFVQWASWLLFFVVIGLYAGAIFLADGWRRVATRAAGLSILIVGLLILAGLRFGGSRLLDSSGAEAEQSPRRGGGLEDRITAPPRHRLEHHVDRRDHHPGGGPRRPVGDREVDPPLHRTGIRRRLRRSLGNRRCDLPDRGVLGAVGRSDELVRHPRVRSNRCGLRGGSPRSVPRRSGPGRSGGSARRRSGGSDNLSGASTER